MVITCKNWHELLPHGLHAYKIVVRTSTSVIPYSLEYRMETVIPIKLEISSLRVLMEFDL
jgi:hypothetical protein